MDRNREREADNHAARVCLHRLMNKIADLGERFNVRKTPIDILGRETQDRSVQIDVVLAGEFGIETGAKLEQCGYAAVRDRSAAGGRKNSSADLEKRTFARAVFADDTKRFSAAHIEVHIS